MTGRKAPVKAIGIQQPNNPNRLSSNAQMVKYSQLTFKRSKNPGEMNIDGSLNSVVLADEINIGRSQALYSAGRNDQLMMSHKLNMNSGESADEEFHLQLQGGVNRSLDGALNIAR